MWACYTVLCSCSTSKCEHVLVYWCTGTVLCCCSTKYTCVIVLFFTVLLFHQINVNVWHCTIRTRVLYCTVLLNHQYVCPCNSVPCCSTTNTYVRVIVSHVVEPPIRMSVYYCPMLLNHQYVCPCNSVPCCSTTNTYVRVLLSHVVQPPIRMSV